MKNTLINIAIISLLLVGLFGIITLLFEPFKTKELTLQDVAKYEIENHPYYKKIYGGNYSIDTVTISSHYAIARMCRTQDTFFIAFDITTEKRYSIVHFCKCGFKWRHDDITGCDGCTHTSISGIEFLYYSKQ